MAWQAIEGLTNKKSPYDENKISDPEGLRIRVEDFRFTDSGSDPRDGAE